ncbi:MAG: response regulator transcription factor [Sphingobacteriales bacterium]|nr:MAG: response regulator transcription factor [Sphingobacteriales bacterium]
MKPAKFKVLLADDHVLLRDALANLINSFEEFTVISSAGNGAELFEEIQKGYMPDLVLLDLNMPMMDGFETTRLLHDRYPDIRILILTMYDSEIALIRLLQMGVRGFLKKDIHPSELKASLLAVANSGYYYSNNATGKLASMFQKHHESQTSLEKSLLNDKEIEFLKFASTDMTYKEIAGKMNMSPRSIDCCRDGLFEKLDVKSRVGLAIYAVKHGIVAF